MQLGMINFNNEIIKGFDFSPLKSKTDYTFLNLIEDKVKKMELFENEYKQSSVDSNDKIIKDKEISSSEIKDKNCSCLDKTEKTEKIEKTEKTENKIAEEEMDSDSVREMVKEVVSLLEKLKKIDGKIFKSFEKEFASIKKGLTAYLKGKELSENNLIAKLHSLLKNLKKALLLKQLPISKNKTLNVLENKNTEKKLDKNKEDSALNLKEMQSKKQKKIFFSRQIKGIKVVKENGGGEKSPLMKNINNKVLNQFEVKNGKVFQMEFKDNISMKKVDVQELINKVANKIKITLGENKSEVVMNLKPEFLGKVSIKMEFKGKTLSAKFIVDNIYAEKILKENLSQLKVHLQDMGMEVQDFDITLNNKRNSNFNTFSDFQSQHENQDHISSQEEEEWLPIVMENYDNLGWIAQNINLVI